MKEQPFEFIVSIPYRQADANRTIQRVHVSMKSPIFVAPYEMSNYLADNDARRLLMAEVKMHMIQAIMDGEWEFEK